MFPIDLYTNSIFANIDSPLFNKAFGFASWLFDPVPFTFLLLISAFLIFKKYGKEGRREVFFFVASSLTAFVLAWALKLTFDITRPLHMRIPAFGPSFPSGHAAVATAYFLSLLHFFRQSKNKIRRYVHVLFCVVCPLFVGVSRLYFGVHWLSDVVGGYSIGALSVYICLKIFYRK